MGAEEDIEGPLNCVYLNEGQFSVVRSQYMNRDIVPGQATTAFGVTANGKLIGAFAISAMGSPASARTGAALRNQIGAHVYMLSDFPVAPTKYARLAKLILYAAFSKETQAALERDYGRRVESMLTTAFTDRPASMKYRGIMKLLSRKEDVPGQKGKEYKFQLNYWSKMGRWSLQEGFKEWLKKHGDKR